MDHLVCFLPGVLALGHLHGVGEAFWLERGERGRERGIPCENGIIASR